MIVFVRTLVRSPAYDKDPVCGMDIEEQTAAATRSASGATYYFCSDRCVEQFDTEPWAYMGKRPDAEPRNEMIGSALCDNSQLLDVWQLASYGRSEKRRGESEAGLPVGSTVTRRPARRRRMSSMIERQTATTQARYNRIAPLYDAMEAVIERALFGRWRRRLWSRLPAGRILEVGVGTGKNMPYYPAGAQVTAIDLSDRMLARARKRAQRLGLSVDLQQMDAQRLDFADHEFDAAVATFVFCSIPFPLQALTETARVVRPGGDIWLLEHVRIDRPVIGAVMDMLNPLIVRTMGANINRRTVENVALAGLAIADVEDLGGDLVKLIHVRV